jgi:hypothetical protein
LTQDKCAIADQYNVGDDVKVSFNLRGREWNSPNGIKYFNTLEIWRIERIGQAQPTASQEQQWRPDSPNVPSGSDNLPF